MSQDVTAADARAAHVPVMRDRILDLLAPALERPDAVYVDGTTGMGGHCEAVLERFPHVRVVGIDRDPQALELAAARCAPFAGRVQFAEAVYSELEDVLEVLGIPAIDGMLLDLGVSSLQIDRRDRGFSYAADAPLDMRMGQGGPTAADILNSYSSAELTRIFRTFGEERFSDRIARRIVEERETEPFTTSARLVQVITGAIPAAARATSTGHPAKRVFQALRIEVNQELEALEAVLPQALDALRVGGRLAVLAYHSLEDRLVKNSFREASSDQAPPHLPLVPDHLKARFAVLTRGAEKPTGAETAENPRAASARLRVIERTREPA